MRRKRLLIPLPATFLAGLALLLLTGGQEPVNETNTVGVPPINGIATLEPGSEICQEPVGIDQAVPQVALVVGTAPKDARPTVLRARVFELPARRLLAEGERRLTRAQAGSSTTPIKLDRPVAPDRLVAVCFTNGGGGDLGVLGDFYATALFTGAGAHPSVTTSTALLDGKDLEKDIAVAFPADPRPTRLAQLPTMIARAARFRPQGVGTWTLWLLLGLAAVGSPFLLVRALGRAAD